MLYKKHESKSSLTEWRHRIFGIVAGLRRGNTLASYLFIICLNYVLQTSVDLIKENRFTLNNARSRRYPTKNYYGADYTGDIALLDYTPTQTESLQDSLDQSARGIGFEVNIDKTEYMFFFN